MADQDRERLLAAFADHLLRNRLTDEKRGRFMVNWVRRFLAYPPPMHGATEEDCLQAYLHVLETEQHKDWQVDQARMAVTAWFAWRRGQTTGPAPVPAAKLSLAADATVDPGQALDALAQTMRVRHYSYRTEQTYLDWVRRFFDYLVSAGQVDNKIGCATGVGRKCVPKEARSVGCSAAQQERNGMRGAA